MSLNEQIAFLLHADKLKNVVRKNKLVSGERNENSAEHSWHVSLQAVVLAGHAPENLKLDTVLKMLTIHDIIEIQAGDHWVTEENETDVATLEAAAAEETFSLLPDNQAAEFKALWAEFEAGDSPEAKFANAMDALHPMLQVFGPNASGFCHQPLSADFLRRKKAPRLAPYPDLWAYAQSLLDAAVRNGYLMP
ncbi:HD domain-containing protein [Labrenzia sp. CE80]|uniref:HD domain-containing protein n=1 Tax=Labrenzia sp. CE80 TaxID=1788986 RepID=UPI00129A20AE|nr:HD domain-containing protein [Labrenzia sp. CE80]